MKYAPSLISIVLLLLTIHTHGSTQPIKVSAYYPIWRQKAILNNLNTGNMPPSQVDFSQMTYLMHFGMGIKGVSPYYNGVISSEDSKQLLDARPEGSNTKILLSFGGGGKDENGITNEDKFVSITTSGNLDNAIESILSLLSDRSSTNGNVKYDGLDIDWEPFTNTIAYQQFMTRLCDKIHLSSDDYIKNLIVTTTVTLDAEGSFAIFDTQNPFGTSPIKDLPNLQQINIQTYDWLGIAIPSWFNSPLYGRTIYDQNYRESDPPPEKESHTHGECQNWSTDHWVSQIINQHIPSSKLGIGIKLNSFAIHKGIVRYRDDPSTPTGVYSYGLVWDKTASDGKPEPISDGRTGSEGDYAYYIMMDQNYVASNYHYDTEEGGINGAEEAYLSFHGSSNESDLFFPYTNQRGIKAKFDYCREKGIQNIIVWEIGGAYLNANSPHLQAGGYRDSLMRTIKSTAFGPKIPPQLLSPGPAVFGIDPAVTFTFSPTIGASMYHLDIAPLNFPPNPGCPPGQRCIDWVQLTTFDLPDPALDKQSFSQTVTLTLGKIYYWRVRAENSGGSIASEVRWIYLVPPEPPLAVSPAEDSTGVTIPAHFEWEEVPGVTDYHLVISNSGGQIVNEQTTSAGAVSVDVPALNPHTTYQWKVSCLSPLGEGTYSPPVSFTTGEHSLAVSYNQGWNMVSIPVSRAQTWSAQGTFPSAPGTGIFGYDHGYSLADTLLNGYGYWARFDDAPEVAFAGSLIDSFYRPSSKGGT